MNSCCLNLHVTQLLQSSFTVNQYNNLTSGWKLRGKKYFYIKAYSENVQL